MGNKEHERVGKVKGDYGTKCRGSELMEIKSSESLLGERS